MLVVYPVDVVFRSIDLPVSVFVKPCQLASKESQELVVDSDDATQGAEMGVVNYSIVMELNSSPDKWQT